MKRARLLLVLLAAAVCVVMLVISTSKADSLGEPEQLPVENTDLPTAKGLPIVIRAAVQFVDVTNVDENEETFAGTVDLRLRWQDLRLVGQKAELRGEAADEALQGMWWPDVALANLEGDPEFRERGLYIEPDGSVELLERTKGTFSTPFAVQNFPFDHQRLNVEVVVRGEELDVVALDFRQSEVEFSRPGRSIDLAEWTPALVWLEAQPLPGWHGKAHARVIASLEVARNWQSVMAPVFIPLFSSMLIPLLALWLNKVEDGEFAVEAFELANLLIGGLFAVIALNFTVNDSYSTLASGDNTITRLFALNYASLALSLVMDVAVFQFGFVQKIAGKWVQEQLFLWSLWAIPVLVLGTASAIVLAAMF